MHSILGEKITYLVTEFSKNPQPFAQAYKAKMAFTHMLFDQSIYDQSGDDFIEAGCTDRGGTYILVGGFANTLKNERWYWPSVQDDIIMFAPQSTENSHLLYNEAFGPPEEKYLFKDFLNTNYDEGDIFQYSTVLTTKALETLEIFMYLKDNCTVPFKMNLMAFNIDIAVEVYKQYEERNSRPSQKSS